LRRPRANSFGSEKTLLVLSALFSLPNEFALGRRRPQTKLHIEIDGALLGKPGTTKTLSDHKASDSLFRFLTILYEAKGIGVLEKLSALRVNRGPFVSN